MKKIFFVILFMLSLAHKADAKFIPKNSSEWSKLEKQIVESVLWENHWKGRWAKGVYWKTNQINNFLNKKEFEAMIVSSVGDEPNEVLLDIYIDELRSILSFLKKGNSYYLIGVSDQWFDDEVANGYFKDKDDHKKGSVGHKFFIRKDYSGVLKKRRL